MILKGNKKIETKIYMQIPAFEDLRKLVATRIDQGLGEEYAALVEANNDPKIKGEPWVSRVVNVEHYVEDIKLGEKVLLGDVKNLLLECGSKKSYMCWR